MSLRNLMGVLFFLSLLGSLPGHTDQGINLSIQKFGQVTPDIYRGGRPSAADIPILQSQYKIHTIVDIEDDTKVIDTEQQTAIGIGMLFLPTPLGSFNKPTDEDVNQILVELQNPSNFPIFLHCHYGEDRTGMIIGLYRVEIQHWTADAAYQEMLTNGFHTFLKGLDSYFRQRTGYTGH